MKLLLTPVPNDTAAAFISAKMPLSRAVFDRLLPELKARAICVTGMTDLDAVQRVRDAIAALPQGADWEDAKDSILSDLSPYIVTSADPDEMAAQLAAAEARAELLLRTHGFQAYAAAEYQSLDEQRDVFPYWEYVSARDDRVRESHAALDGLVIPCDSSFWSSHYPPWDWGCRCQVRPRTAAEAGELPAAADAGVGDRRVAPPHMVKQLEQGSLVQDGLRLDVRAPVDQGKPNAWSWQPGDLRLPLDKIAERYDDETARAFSSFAQSVPLPELDKSLYDWLFDPLLDTDAAAAVASAKTERAVLRNYETAASAGEVSGTANGVDLGKAIASARSDGDTLAIEHNHPAAPDATPSPRDVATLLANPDVVISIGTSTGYAGHVTDRTVIRHGEPLSDAGRAKLVKRIQACQRPDGTLTVSRKEWYDLLRQLEQVQGAIRYENTTP